jgi:hypothetical protein
MKNAASFKEMIKNFEIKIEAFTAVDCSGVFFRQ